MCDEAERKEKLSIVETKIVAMARQCNVLGDDLAAYGFTDGAYQMHRYAHKLRKVTNGILDFTIEGQTP
ncbi:MAG: hypothetical protein HQL95_09110 [Magnetococcales bacterium]|nr:hypothetical protein [Magnetococcales bacterium]